jgi:hypothetical protein
VPALAWPATSPIVTVQSTAEDQRDAMSPYGRHDLLGEIRRDPQYFSGVLAACMGRVRAPTETRHVTEVLNVAATADQVYQAGFAQRTWCLLDAWRMGSGAGRRSDDIPVPFHSTQSRWRSRAPAARSITVSRAPGSSNR